MCPLITGTDPTGLGRLSPKAIYGNLSKPEKIWDPWKSSNLWREQLGNWCSSSSWDGPSFMTHSKHKLPSRGGSALTKWTCFWQDICFTTAPNWFGNLIFMWFWAQNVRSNFFPPPVIYRSFVLEKRDMREKNGWEETLSTSVSLTFPVHN